MAIALAAWACEPENIVFPQTGSVVTLVDSGPALGSARTFALPDTVMQLSDAGGTIGHAADAEILASIRGHLMVFGWRDATRSEFQSPPDVLVLVAAATRIETTAAYGDWYGSWGYLPYWGASVDASWGWGTPAGAIPYSFPAGTLLVTMLDLRAQREDTKRIPLLWAAAIDGALSSNTAQRALVGIDQAFAQSAYLRLP